MTELSNLEQQITAFAKTKPRVSAVSRGNCPEEGTKVYWFHINPPYDFNLGTEISDLLLQLSPSEYFEARLWPENQEALFLGERIYAKS